MKRINVKPGDRVIFHPLRPVGEPWIGDNETGAWLRAGSIGTVTRIPPTDPDEYGYAFVTWESDGATFDRCIDAEDEETGWKKEQGE